MGTHNIGDDISLNLCSTLASVELASDCFLAAVAAMAAVGLSGEGEKIKLMKSNRWERCDDVQQKG